MATIRKRGEKWQAQVRLNGINRAESFTSERQAKSWATQVEAEILAGKTTKVANKTFGELLERYRDEVTPTHRGEIWETRRINLILRSEVKVDRDRVLLADVKLADLGPRHFSAWRDERLKSISPESVRREWTILNSAINIAKTEWQWLQDNPMKGVKRPEKGKARSRIASENEVDSILFSSGYTPGQQPTTSTAKVGAAFLLCSETGLRKGELLNLTVRDVHLADRYLHVGGGKTLAAERDVPLTTKAVAVLTDLIGDKTEGPVIELTDTQADALFRKVVKRCGIEDLHFHDSRACAATKLAKRLHVLELARALGHKDLKMLSEVYYRESATNIAAKLD